MEVHVPSNSQNGTLFWRVERASRAAVIIDAEDYFAHLRSAMLQARTQIILIGWDFDACIKLDGRGGDDGPSTVGRFISWLAKRRPSLHVYILRWDLGALKALFDVRTLLTVVRWLREPQIHLKLDGHHPIAASHHQKIVVVDDCVAFCGGIDVTRNRFDARQHADGDPRRSNPDGSRFGPWHDATTALEGPVARALGQMCRARWAAAGGKSIDPVEGHTAGWPQCLKADFEDVSVGLSRTLPPMGDHGAIHEIEALYVSLIHRARRWIYAESQYFASRRIAEAIANRLHEPEGPEVVIVCPVVSSGWLEPVAMDSARARLVAALRQCDRQGRFRLYHPVTNGGKPIYVHAKILVVDNDVLKIGSSNLNNRSLRLDSECDVTFDTLWGREGSVANTIARVQSSLLAEHLGVSTEVVSAKIAETGSLIKTIDSLREGGRSLLDYELPELASVTQWLADNKVLDPEGPEEMFEPIASRPGLLARLRHRGGRRE